MAAWCANTPCCSIRRCLRLTASPAAPQPAMPCRGWRRPLRARFPVPRQTEPQSRRRPVAAGGGDSYEVQRGDSLSAIARRLSASTGARTDQLMVAIYRGNSGAFEGDMNRLRAGAVLRIPERRRNRRGVPVGSQRRSAPPGGRLGRLEWRRQAAAACGWCRRATPLRARALRRQCRRSRCPAESRARARRPAHRIQAHARAAQYRTCRSAGEAGRLAAAAAPRSRTGASPDQWNSRCRSPRP